MDAAAGLAHVAERSRVWRKFVRNPAAIAGALILLVVIGAAIFAPYVAPHEHTRQSLIRRLTPPVWAGGGKAPYLLGTDQVGRDILGLTGWERYTRVVRAEVLALREKDFIEAARAIGASPLRTLLRHLLPNTFSSIIVLSTLQVAQAILQEAALSFLGVGTGSAYPTWGHMIALGRDFVSVAWWFPTFPGLAILLTVLAINLVGDRLRDALDPRVG